MSRPVLEQPARLQQQQAAGSIDLGARIARLRGQQGLSLQQLAIRTGIGQQTLRKIEQGRQSPRIALLQQILAAVGSDFDRLLAMEDPHDRRSRRSITRVQQRRALGQNQQLLNADLLSKKMLPIYNRLSDVSRPGGVFEKYPGEVFVMVLRGQLRLRLPDYQTLSLNRGDSVYFDGNQGYRIDNPDSVVAEWLTLIAAD
ncbi:helix-turn-helix domain-containing protein [Motiliproteus coralliicola]|uniref:helix-turn-helix domain-containing protein n=1 Tax=Motiliproteus coralliicola TaxID=2283196 RepID=UPI0014029101|nr:XRE family transcriptional regulator [Motiliproteus coralliicola]